MPAHILILDDDADVACAARLLLRRRYERVSVLEHPAGLDALLAEAMPDVVLLDLNFSAGRTDGAEGLAVLARLRTLPCPPSVIALTAYADVPLAVQALKCGASDFLTKPWDNAHLLAAIDSALARRAPATGSVAGLMGQSSAMREVQAMIQGVGPTEANVLILGENGVGKELVAQALHQASRRAAGSFLPVDMGSLPEATFESELFGHRRGAFTDARTDRPGRFQAASGGTLFLDEIGNLPLAAQAKLLTALERRAVTPLGADRAEAIDVRVLSATNLDETALCDPARFRTDLLYRLNTIVIRVPPLRARRADIGLLLDHYLRHYEHQYARDRRDLQLEAQAALSAHDWPGNVRALRHACERAVILATSTDYRLADFGLQASAAPTAPSEQLRLGALEREAINSALTQAGGNISKAARLLGVSRAALYRKVDKHGL